ncbi:hypothetical protein HanXRQr2_Chr17g0816851 [Helianthus annuus]|uniref:Uncharacterized protein n=1 Tax=Helianthus annuus TaxID=4232 RepID=A0A9K3DJL0_HELAN|nr:hypothetical protein HanXRQr2_Chr17g0816851 [Helianthus annuus]
MLAKLTLNKLGGSLERNGSNGSWMQRMFARTRGKLSLHSFFNYNTLVNIDCE